MKAKDLMMQDDWRGGMSRVGFQCSQRAYPKEPWCLKEAE